MRVVSGKAKGRVLIAPEGTDTRPITAKIKEALFSSWQMRLQDSWFLDLFSGSGSMGIEAISRGAQKVVFVEKERKAVNIIKQNLDTCKFKSEYELYQDDVFRQIEVLKKKGYKFDIIYLDPPFTVDSIFIPVMEALSDGLLLNEDGFICIRTLDTKEMPVLIGKLEKTKYKKYGISGLHTYMVIEE